MKPGSTGFDKSRVGITSRRVKTSYLSEHRSVLENKIQQHYRAVVCGLAHPRKRATPTFQIPLSTGILSLTSKKSVLNGTERKVQGFERDIDGGGDYSE